MTLTWKDAVATLLVVGVGIVTYARLKGFDWPLLGSWRAGVLVLFGLGIATCIVAGSGSVPDKNAWTVAGSVLGGVAFALIIAGLIANSKMVFLALALDILALWLLTTMHHIIEKGV